MNVDFFAHDSGGLIIRTGSCPEPQVHIQPEAEGEFVRLGKADMDTQYFDIASQEILEYTMEERQAKARASQFQVWKMPERILQDIRELADAKNQAWARIKESRDKAEAAPFECDGAKYDSNQLKINGAVSLALISGEDFSIRWILFDNTTKVLDRAGMMRVGAALGMRIKGIYETGDDLRTQINAASTVPQVDAIDWPDEEV